MVETMITSGVAVKCPVCKGLGIARKKDIAALLSKPHEIICPSCPSYHTNSICTAWIPIGKGSAGQDWLFDSENACYELIKIISALETIGLMRDMKAV